MSPLYASGPHKLRAPKREPAPRYRLNPPLYHTFDQVAGLLWIHPGHRVQDLKTARGAIFWAEVQHSTERPGESIIRGPWEWFCTPELWGWNKAPNMRMYLTAKTRALDNWALRFYGAPERNGYLRQLLSTDMPLALSRFVWEPPEPGE